MGIFAGDLPTRYIGTPEIRPATNGYQATSVKLSQSREKRDESPVFFNEIRVADVESLTHNTRELTIGSLSLYSTVSVSGVPNVHVMLLNDNKK